MIEFMKKLENEAGKKAKNFAKRLTSRILGGNNVFTAEYHHSTAPIPLKKSIDLPRKPITEGAVWGNTWESGYFKLTAEVPREWKGKIVAAHIDLGGESLIYNEKGIPLYGLTNGSVFAANYSKDVYRIFEPCKGGEQVTLYVEAAANGLFGVNRQPDSERNAPTRHGEYEGEVKRIRLCTFDESLWHLYLDVNFLVDLAYQLEEDSVRRARIFRGIQKAIVAFADDNANAEKARAILAPFFKDKNTTALKSVAVGHAHIDVGWLWRIQESERKAARTFASQIANIKRYPGYVFGASQPVLYQFVKDNYPELYADIKKAVLDGSWELQGGMWVEADCNIISGESMIRQFVHGKNFFKDEFGADVKNLWLPDVFGYSANLPQILKRSGIDFFLTQKISWSQFNVFRHNTFIWRGIDGSEVITHFPPEDNYNSLLMPGAFKRAERNFKEKAFLDEFMTLAGIGDGGGGPKEEHIEAGLRARDCEGIPRNDFGKADAFFDRLAERADELDVFSGELYLELHRATLTTQARTKRYNRFLENKLRQTEAICALAPLASYPRTELDAVWKMLLTHQFHDIIPGSSIKLVYDDAHRNYENGLAVCTSLIDAASKSLCDNTPDTMTLFNCISYPYTASIPLPSGWNGAVRADGVPVAVQSENGLTVMRTRIEPNSTAVITKAANAKAAAEKNDLILENDLIRYRFSKEGQLIEAFDKEAGRAVLRTDEKANVFALYEDHPNNWDAWDIDHDYDEGLLETATCVSASAVMHGDARSSVRFSFTVSASTIEQTVSLDADSKRLTFATNVQWDEAHRMLRVAFPVAVRSDEAAFDIQYGYAKRPTHTNTSLDYAKFEVVGHRYADLSDNDYGVALLNDCKYGYKVRGNVIDLNILRSPRDPDPDADIGTHTFTYALLPHTGTLTGSTVMAEAEQLNIAPLMLTGKMKAAVPISVSGSGISMTVVKKAEKEECIIIRLVETLGKNSSGSIRLKGSIVETNLMEWENGKKETVNGDHAVSLAPFEIRTYKVYLS